MDDVVYKNRYTFETASRSELYCQFYDDVIHEGDYKSVDDWLSDEGWVKIEEEL